MIFTYTPAGRQGYNSNQHKTGGTYGAQCLYYLFATNRRPLRGEEPQQGFNLKVNAAGYCGGYITGIFD